MGGGCRVGGDRDAPGRATRGGSSASRGSRHQGLAIRGRASLTARGGGTVPASRAYAAHRPRPAGAQRGVLETRQPFFDPPPPLPEATLTVIEAELLAAF